MSFDRLLVSLASRTTSTWSMRRTNAMLTRSQHFFLSFRLLRPDRSLCTKSLIIEVQEREKIRRSKKFCSKSHVYTVPVSRAVKKNLSAADLGNVLPCYAIFQVVKLPPSPYFFFFFFFLLLVHVQSCLVDFGNAMMGGISSISELLCRLRRTLPLGWEQRCLHVAFLLARYCSPDLRCSYG
jgi:hypothetical protein